MSKELRFIIDQISREKGISQEVLRNTLESAMLSAVKKKFSTKENVQLNINPDTYEIMVYEVKTAVKKVKDETSEISLEDAYAFDNDAKIGNPVQIPLDIKDFGRIAAQTAKQVLFQKVREAEREVIYDEFINKVGTIVSGTVLRREKGTYFVGVGKAEAILPLRETIHGEQLKSGNKVRAYIEAVNTVPKGPIIMLTRAKSQFAAGLFRMEVPEINDGIVEIKGIVREAGERTKIAVLSNDPSIDPVGACVGMKGTRVQAIVRELRGERIDIIPWTEDPRIYIARALSPAMVDKIGINSEDKTAMVVVEDQQLAIAIGKKGANVRLAMKLTGWDIDIISESNYTKMREEEEEQLEEISEEEKEENID